MAEFLPAVLTVLRWLGQPVFYLIYSFLNFWTQNFWQKEREEEGVKTRKKSFAFCGGAFGDEGKGRIVDKFVSDYSQKGPVFVYRDNGGANAGHTVELESGERIALHQLPSGVLVENTTVVLGKGMVLHPGDLIEEIKQVKQILKGKIRSEILIDEMAVLSLDTHRAFEAVLKEWQAGGKGATGRGISPAYADVLLRHPLRMRDLRDFTEEKIQNHYLLYESLLAGLGVNLAEVLVPSLAGEEKKPVGDRKEFTQKLRRQAQELNPLISSVFALLKEKWADQETAFIFEKSQAVGLDPRYGVYPDVTASDCTFGGIYFSTEGVVDPAEIEIRAGVIKATYMSSVGTRKLPTEMEEELANRIREDAWEYGATTRRPRGIAYLDLPALKFFARSGKINRLVLTHMDIVYPDVSIRVCVDYKVGGKSMPYRPDQEFLNKVRPVYLDLPTWDKGKISQARKMTDLPLAAKEFLSFIARELNLPILMITAGPKREQGIIFN